MEIYVVAEVVSGRRGGNVRRRAVVAPSVGDAFLREYGCAPSDLRGAEVVEDEATLRVITPGARIYIRPAAKIGGKR